ncbi:MAG: hemolysin secretion protein D [Rhodospirillaceae bacterium]|nr:hemolysin secretion protein D [Rhodospirillaceae bacterium]HAA91880.1 HlyD family type I secretion periplasmic adaptor subunit [Rhodospirillaceae bacterium]
MNSKSRDIDFMSDLDVAMKKPPRLLANFLLLGVVLFLVWAVVWTSQAEIEQVTAGTGQVIPSKQIQIVQNLEGGILAEILVREGARVEKGQLIVRLDDTLVGASFREGKASYAGLLAAIARLTAEAGGKEPVFPDALRKEYPDGVNSEYDLFQARQSELKASIAVLTQKKEQKKQELIELVSRINQLGGSLKLAREELRFIAQQVARGTASRVKLLRLKRQINDLQGDLAVSEKRQPRALAAVNEVSGEILRTRETFRARALKELNETRAKANATKQGLEGKGDRVRRTDVRAPVTGTVKRVNVNTIGGVIKPGQDLVEIVPLDDSLLIEAKIRPQDIAFVHPGQNAKVKITAYDYTVYGTMDAKLEHISADTIVDDEGNSFYLIRVRTKNQTLTDKTGNQLPIIPGMTAEVDIITGKRTILEYLLKPLLRAKGKALREA